MRKSPTFSNRTCIICDTEYTPKSACQRCCSKKCKITRKEQRRIKYLLKDGDSIRGRARDLYVKRKQRNSLNLLLNGCRGRARQKNIEFSITEEDLTVPDVCPILGTKFEYNTPYAMSVDRIDPSLGYVKNNIQILSRKANVMKSNATIKELVEFADWVYKNYKNN